MREFTAGCRHRRSILFPTGRSAKLAAMPLAGVVGVCCIFGSLSACSSPDRPAVDWTDDTRRDTNAWIVRSLADRQRDSAIIRHRTLQNHHFVPGMATLTEIGARNLAVLAAHYVDADTGAEGVAGMLVVRPGSASPALYEARVAEARRVLGGHGVAIESVQITSGFGLGDGIAGDTAARIFAVESPDDPHNYHGGPDTK